MSRYTEIEWKDINWVFVPVEKRNQLILDFFAEETIDADLPSKNKEISNFKFQVGTKKYSDTGLHSLVYEYRLVRK